MRSAGIEGLVESHHDPLAATLGLGCFPARKFRLRRENVRVIHIENYKFHIAVVKDVDSRTHISAGRGAVIWPLKLLLSWFPWAAASKWLAKGVPSAGPRIHISSHSFFRCAHHSG